MTSSVDTEIFAEPVPGERSEAAWSAIIDHLVGALGHTLATPLVVQTSSVIDGLALSCRFRGTSALLGALTVGVSGIVGLESIDGHPMVDAVVFLHTGALRLGTDTADVSYAAFEYRPPGRWEFRGWTRDVYREYAHRPSPFVQEPADPTA